jgi:hypothetical protein
MMSREKLLTLRKRVKAGEALDRDQALAVIDHGIAAYEMEGGESALRRREERVEGQLRGLAARERQVRLALADLRDVLTLSPRSPRPQVDVARAQLILDLVDEMLKAKGPAWHREWAWYQPRVDEEFDSDIDQAVRREQSRERDALRRERGSFET